MPNDKVVAQIKKSYLTAKNAINRFIEEKKNIELTYEISELIARRLQNKKKILICGNGGSLCDSMHFAEEFTGRFRKNRPALPVISLTDPAHITCVGNDFGFDSIFSRGVEAYGNKDDILIGLSTSGNSANIIAAIKEAQNRKMTTICLLGKEGGKLKNTADYQFIVNEKTSDRIQEVHMTILHIVIEGVERILYPQNY